MLFALWDLVQSRERVGQAICHLREAVAPAISALQRCGVRRSVSSTTGTHREWRPWSFLFPCGISKDIDLCVAIYYRKSPGSQKDQKQLLWREDILWCGVNITTQSGAFNSPHLPSSLLASLCGKVRAAGRTCVLGHHAASQLQPGYGHRRQTSDQLTGCMRNQPSLCSAKIRLGVICGALICLYTSACPSQPLPLPHIYKGSSPAGLFMTEIGESK